MTRIYVLFVLVLYTVTSHVSGSNLKIVSLSMTDLGSVKHACSKAAFKQCEDTFQKHVAAIKAYNDLDDKQDLWCQVLQSHKVCMDDVLEKCLADYPILSHKVQNYMKEVVHRGCQREGKPIDNGCAKYIRQKRDADLDGKTLYDLASDCLKRHTAMDPVLKNLMTLLKHLTRSIQHLYKRLPEQ